MNAYTHELKTDTEPFAAILSGEKTHEIRYDDRGFKVGDTLVLREIRYSRGEMFAEGRPLEYTGRTVERVVTHIQRGYGLPRRMVVMSLAASAPAAVADTAINPKDVGLPPYPKDHVVGPCVCGSWPGGECLKCPVIPGSEEVIADTAGASESNWAFEAAKINLDRIHAVCMEFGCRPQETVVDWLRERLTVGNPVVWAVYCGLGEMRPISVHFKKEEALKVASEIKSNTDVRPLYDAPVGRHDPSEAERNHRAFKDGLNAKLDAAESRDRQRFECAARKQGTAGGNDAADCDYPGCGCDPSVDLKTEVFMRKNYGWTKS